MTSSTSIQNKLTHLVDDDYRAFAIKGIFTDYPFLGVRTPDLRNLAKEIEKSEEGKNFLEEKPESYEELTIQGFIIASLPYEEMKKRLPAYVAKIDNWATTDMVASTIKSIKKNREDFLNVIDEFIKSPREFTVRMALVCLKGYYITPDYLAVIFDRKFDFGVAHFKKSFRFMLKNYSSDSVYAILKSSAILSRLPFT